MRSVRLMVLFFSIVTQSLVGTAAKRGSQTAAQTVAAPKLEAATVKLNTSADNSANTKFDPEHFSYTNLPLKVLLAQIYRLKAYQIAKAPNWLSSERWDIVAKSDGPSTMAQKNELLKSLLAERFELQFHNETRDLPLYDLIIAKNGP